MEALIMIDKISWLGHASFKIRGQNKVIYIDPWKLKGDPEPADIILVGHSHYDHFSAPDIRKIAKPSTILIAPADCSVEFDGEKKDIRPGETLVIDDVTVEAVPAYNPGKPFHPREKGWVGFILTLEEERLYYASDTDLVPEMSRVKDIDVALFPVGGTYTMDPKAAALAAETIKPRIAVPYHYGDIVGTKKDAEAFSSRFSGETRILTNEM